MKRCLPALTLILASLALPARALPPHAPVPGGIAVIELPAGGAREAWFDERRALVSCDDDRCHAVVGIPLSAAPGQTALHTLDATGARVDIGFTVGDKAYATQRLTIANRRKVDPNAEDLARIIAERDSLDAALGR
ncbi:MAG: M23 family peptidase, partial [Pseudomonadota bacterium]